MSIEVKFGKKLRTLRLKQKITQEELSFRSRLSKNYISDVECGRRNVSLKALEQIALGLNVKLKDLMDFELE